MGIFSGAPIMLIDASLSDSDNSVHTGHENSGFLISGQEKMKSENVIKKSGFLMFGQEKVGFSLFN